MSPRWKAGAIDSEMTTTMGCDDLVMIDSAFQTMYDVPSTRRSDKALDRPPRRLEAEKNRRCCGPADRTVSSMLGKRMEDGVLTEFCSEDKETLRTLQTGQIKGGLFLVAAPTFGALSAVGLAEARGQRLAQPCCIPRLLILV